MNIKAKKTRWVLLAGLVLLIAVVGAVLAAGDFSIDWWTVDGGGATSSGGDYVVSGSIGQPEAGTVMLDGDFSLVGGFWGGGSVTDPLFAIYLPVVTR